MRHGLLALVLLGAALSLTGACAKAPETLTVTYYYLPG